MMIIAMKMGDAVAYMRRRHKKPRYSEWEQVTQARLSQIGYKGTLRDWEDHRFRWYVENGKLGLAAPERLGLTRDGLQVAWKSMKETTAFDPQAVFVPTDIHT